MQGSRSKSAVEPLGVPPRAREELLAHVDQGRVELYRVAAEILEELDRVAPWASLYFPPSNQQSFLGMTGGLLSGLDGAAVKLESMLASPAAAAVEEAARDDMRFYFSGIHEMVRGDVERLEQLLAPLRRRFATSIEEKSFVCQVAADLKGKYTSALMGAVAGLVAEGRWSVAEVEPVLFPEKAAEGEASQLLLEGLDELLDLLEGLARNMVFADLHGRWSRGEPADLYVLADLFAFKGRLGMLLKSSQRRALYSGDYHELRRREGQLSLRLADLESRHRATWSDRVRPIWESGDLSSLCQLVLEVAALMDSRSLSEMVTEEWLGEMRSMAIQIRALGSAEDREEDEADVLDLATSALPPRWSSLVPLLAQPDLRRYLLDLRRAVEKRQALRTETARLPAGGVEEPVEDTLVLDALTEDSIELDLRLAETGAAARTGPEPEVPAAPAAEGSVEAESSPEETLVELKRRLQDLRSTNNGRWNSFRMTERLLSKHGRIPPGMFASARPFVAEVTEEILPLVVSGTLGGVLTAQETRRLESYCSFLLDVEPSPARLEHAIPHTMKRLLSLLDALEGLGSEVGSSSGE